MERKRITAKKVSAKEITSGRYVKKTGFESSYVLTNMGRRLSRIRVLGLIVDKWTAEDGSRATMTVDDGSDTLRCKVFVNVGLFDGLNAGDLVDAIGKLREYNGEIYMMPEIVRKAPSNWEALRSVELKKIWSDQRTLITKVMELKKQTADATELKTLAKKLNLNMEDVEGIIEAEDMLNAVHEQKIENTDAREKILGLVQTLDGGMGVSYDNILSSSGIPESTVDSTITQLLEDGVCFEPKAGMIKKL